MNICQYHNSRIQKNNFSKFVNLCKKLGINYDKSKDNDNFCQLEFFPNYALGITQMD